MAANERARTVHHRARMIKNEVERHNQDRSTSRVDYGVGMFGTVGTLIPPCPWNRPW
jgi:hypothetical protein